MIPSVRVPGQSPPVTQVEFLRAGAGVTRSDSDEGLQQRELWSQIRYRDHTEIPILWNIITVCHIYQIYYVTCKTGHKMQVIYITV